MKMAGIVIRRIGLLCSLLLALPALAEPGHVSRASDLMDEPYRDANVLTTLEEGGEVDILERKGGWYNVTAGEQTGWVRMLNIRKDETSVTAESEGGTETSDVLELASGRAGTGNVVATTGVRGLNEEELKQAQFNPVQIKKLESFAVNDRQARQFARNGGLKARDFAFLPAPSGQGGR